MNRYQLATRYDAVHRNVYVPWGQVLLSPSQKAHAAWLFSQRRATLVSVSAVAMHGPKWIDERLPAELNQRSQRKTRGIVLHNEHPDGRRGRIIRVSAEMLRYRRARSSNAPSPLCGPRHTLVTAETEVMRQKFAKFRA